MNKQTFAQLLTGLNQMQRHVRGEHVPGVRITQVQKVRGKTVYTNLTQPAQRPHNPSQPNTKPR